MNKFALLLCFLLIANISAEEKDMVERIYNIVINILKGMSEKGDNSCANIFVNKKGEIFPIFKELVNEVKSGKSLSEVVSSYGLRLLAVEDLAVNCKAFALFELFTKMTSKEGIKDIGASIQSHAGDISNYFSQMKATKEIEKKVIIAGKIFAKIFNLQVY